MIITVSKLKPEITCFGSKEIVRVAHPRRRGEMQEMPVVCHLCQQTTKRYIIFGERSIGECCFPRIEREMLRRMPDFLTWINRIVKSKQQYVEDQTEIINNLIHELGGQGIQFAPKPTNQIPSISEYEITHEFGGNDLFGSGSGSGYCSDEHPMIGCEWCDNVKHYNGTDSIPYTHFADYQVLDCCWPAIEKSTFHFLPQIIPWFISQLQDCTDQAKHLQDWLSDIKKTVS